MSNVVGNILLAMSVVTAGCATAGVAASDVPNEELTGHITVDEHGTWFSPCGDGAGGPRWWVTFTDRSVQQIQGARASGQALSGSRSYVQWLAALTDEKHVGPGGTAVLVRDIREIRAPSAADCE